MAKSFVRVIDRINEWTAKIVAWLIVPLMLIVVFDVILRYVFNRPAIWAWDVNIQLLGAIGILSSGYVLLHKGHIKVDVLVARLSPKKQAMIDLTTSTVFFFCVGVAVWQTGFAGWESVQMRETLSTAFRAPVYIFKIVIPVGFFLLGLQGIAKFIRDLSIVTSREVQGHE